MTNDQRVPVRTGWAPSALAGLLVALSLLALPAPAAAAVNCAAPVAGVDSDGDGFTDAQECAGFFTSGTNPKRFDKCLAGAIRENCVDPDSKDVFVIYARAATGSLLAEVPTPFAARDFPCTWCGTAGIIRFTGMSPLGITVHQLAPTEVTSNRVVITGSTQKAVKVSESLDVSTADILGNCQWGTPNGLDGCAVYTKRAKNFIDTKCNLAKDTTTNRNEVFLAYATWLVVHEAGHTMGGLAAKYDAANGGYHYPTTSGFVMSQSVQYSTQAGKCTWYIPSTWNATLDAAGAKLK